MVFDMVKGGQRLDSPAVCHSTNNNHVRGYITQILHLRSLNNNVCLFQLTSGS